MLESDYESIPSLLGSLSLSYQGLGLMQSQYHKLKSGQLAIDQVCDLHGLTAREAFYKLDELLKQAHRKQARLLLIIHGKGHPTKGSKIKGLVKTMLTNNPTVLAFCSAKQKDGGTGAVYCLLRK